MIDDELRELGPDGLSADRHLALREQLLATIAADPGEQPGTGQLGEPEAVGATGRPRSRRTPVLLVAAAVLAVAALAAGLATRGAEAPDDADVVATTTPAPLDDQPVLTAQHVPCIMSTPERSRSVDLATPADQPFVPQTAVDACEAAVADLLEGGIPAPGVPCRTVDDAVPTPVVVIAGSNCAGKGYEDLRPDDVAALDEVRSLEASLWAIPSRCPTRDELLSWMTEQVEASTVAASVIPSTDAADPEGCWEPTVDWAAGTITAAPSP